jgi:hypothetical protein
MDKKLQEHLRPPKDETIKVPDKGREALLEIRRLAQQQQK